MVQKLGLPWNVESKVCARLFSKRSLVLSRPQKLSALLVCGTLWATTKWFVLSAFFLKLRMRKPKKTQGCEPYSVSAWTVEKLNPTTVLVTWKHIVICAACGDHTVSGETMFKSCQVTSPMMWYVWSVACLLPRRVLCWPSGPWPTQYLLGQQNSQK